MALLETVGGQIDQITWRCSAPERSDLGIPWSDSVLSPQSASARDPDRRDGVTERVGFIHATGPGELQTPWRWEGGFEPPVPVTQEDRSVITGLIRSHSGKPSQTKLAMSSND